MSPHLRTRHNKCTDTLITRLWKVRYSNKSETENGEWRKEERGGGEVKGEEKQELSLCLRCGKFTLTQNRHAH